MDVGQRVHYDNGHGKIENGIVKSISDKENVFVVYNCGGNWNHYQEYTAARTRITDLKLGWIL
ncbi:MAG: hypothetical protein QOA70_06855 [Nitrososphaeraceae archaeon]|nr:hypothetical protein [Nitrososphaeraceae archaeon]